jgi:hypothetical protein
MMAILRRMLWLALIAAAIWLTPWRPQALASLQPPAGGAAVRQPLPGAAVRTAPAGHRAGATPGRKGATDYWLESQTARLTARYDDGMVAVAGRKMDGNFETRLTDRSGAEVARLGVSRVVADGGGADAVLRYTSRNGEALNVNGDSTVRPTLAWANAQAYTLTKDGVPGAAGLEWRNGLMRRRGAPGRDVERQLSELHTEWSGGLSVRTVRRTAVNLPWNGSRALNGDMLVSRLLRDGVQIGSANWFVKEEILIWDIPGVTAGSLTAAELKPFGGWPFTPDAEWLNLQTIAFYHFKAALEKRSAVAARPPAASWPQQVLNFFVAPVQADEAGCDSLHWLDGTTLRYCCDAHDLCYEKYGCNWKSWWQFWSSWTCDACNAGAVFCFLAGGAGRGPFHPYPM